MTSSSNNVVIVGGGVVGIATAYFLARAGVPSTVVERDSVGSHASGFAYGGLSPLSGAGIPGPVFPLAQKGMEIHRELSQLLPEETGVNTEYRKRPLLSLAFTEDEARHRKATIPWQREQDGYVVDWLDLQKAREVEPRISDEVIGAVYTEGGAEVEPYRFILALTQAAEKMGVTVRHGNVTGLKRDGNRVVGVVTESGVIECDKVVLALGPWSGETSSWVGLTFRSGL